MATSPDIGASVAERLRARRRRIARIRKRVLAGTSATFVLAWGVIFAQLVSGHDPALAKHRTATTAASATPKTSSSGSTRSTSSGSTSSATSSSAIASPVTTSQS